MVFQSVIVLQGKTKVYEIWPSNGRVYCENQGGQISNVGLTIAYHSYILLNVEIKIKYFFLIGIYNKRNRFNFFTFILLQYALVITHTCTSYRSNRFFPAKNQWVGYKNCLKLAILSQNQNSLQVIYQQTFIYQDSFVIEITDWGNGYVLVAYLGNFHLSLNLYGN